MTDEEYHRWWLKGTILMIVYAIGYGIGKYYG
jgi:hypothetical protein